MLYFQFFLDKFIFLFPLHSLTEETNNYIWRMGKKTFPSNLEAMVEFFMKREENLYNQVQALEKRKPELSSEIRSKEELLADLDQLKQTMDKLLGKRSTMKSQV